MVDPWIVARELIVPNVCSKADVDKIPEMVQFSLQASWNIHPAY